MMNAGDIAYPEQWCSRPPFGHVNGDWSLDNVSPHMPMTTTSANMAMVIVLLGNTAINKAWLPTMTPTVAYCVLSPSRRWRHGLECD